MKRLAVVLAVCGCAGSADLQPEDAAKAALHAQAWAAVMSFFIQDVCTDNPDLSPIDPACREHRDLGPGERLPYHKANGDDVAVLSPVLGLMSAHVENGVVTALRVQSETSISNALTFDVAPTFWRGAVCPDMTSDVEARLDALPLVDVSVLAATTGHVEHAVAHGLSPEKCDAATETHGVDWELGWFMFDDVKLEALVITDGDGRSFYTRELGLTLQQNPVTPGGELPPLDALKQGEMTAPIFRDADLRAPPTITGIDDTGRVNGTGFNPTENVLLLDDAQPVIVSGDIVMPGPAATVRVYNGVSYSAPFTRD